MKLDPQNASDPQTANHHWYPFLRYKQECAKDGREVSVNDWLILNGKVKDYKEEARARAEAAAIEETKARVEAAANEEAKAKSEQAAKAQINTEKS